MNLLLNDLPQGTTPSSIPNYPPPQAKNNSYNFMIRKIFDILGIVPFLSIRNVNVTYRKLALRHNSDKWNNKKEFILETIVENFKSILNTFIVLKY